MVKPQVGNLGGRKITVISSGSVNRNTMAVDKQALVNVRDLKLVKLADYTAYLLYLESVATEKSKEMLPQIKKIKQEVEALRSQIAREAEEGFKQLNSNLQMGSLAAKPQSAFFGLL